MLHKIFRLKNWDTGKETGNYYSGGCIGFRVLGFRVLVSRVEFFFIFHIFVSPEIQTAAS